MSTSTGALYRMMGRRKTPDASVECGVSLRSRVSRARRPARLRALVWVLPLLVFILIAFVAPILSILPRSVENPHVVEVLARTIPLLKQWDETGGRLPDETVFGALADDLRNSEPRRTVGWVGRTLDYEKRGLLTLFRKAAGGLDRLHPPYRQAFIEIDDGWGDIGNWRVIKREGRRYTPYYYIAAMDHSYDHASGHIVANDRRVFLTYFWRTLWMGALVVLLCTLLGYPVAFLLSSLPSRAANVLMLLVLFPFWTSLLVRTAAWMVILQNKGVLNDLLVWLGMIGEDERLHMVHNKIGTIVAMTHVLLPFMILPLYSVMKTIPASLVHAARLMGADPLVAFRRIYFPNTVPGIGAGAILVFVVYVGYYITPELIGGQASTQIGNAIVYQFNYPLNWGLAAALGTLLLALVLTLYVMFIKAIGIDKIKFN